MKNALMCAAIITLGALFALIVDVSQFVRTLDRTAGELPDRVERVIRSEAEATRKALDARLQAVSVLVDNRLASIEGRAQSELRATRGETLALIDHHATQIRLSGMEELRLTRAEALRRLDPPLYEISSLLREYRAVPGVVGARLDRWTDCSGNGACWQAQITAALGASRATLGETARTMRVVRETAPSIAANFDQTTKNVERLTRPDHWAWKTFKFLSPIGAGAIFGAIK